VRNTRWFETRGITRLGQGFEPNWSGLFQSTAFSSLPLDFRHLAAHDPTVEVPGTVAVTSYSLTPSVTTVIEGNQITFTISRSGDKPAETLYFSTLSDGTATYAEGDYSTTSGGSPANIAISFSSGTTSRTVTLNILNDGVSDSGEQFRAIVQRNPSDPVSTYLVRSSYVTINDPVQSTSYSLTASPSTVVEGNQVTFTITRSGDKPAETVYFSTLADGTATFSEGDYATTSGGSPTNIAVSFSSGTTSRTVTLNIISDGVSDSGEQFRAIVQRSSSDPVSTYLDRSSYVTINDAAASTSYSLTPDISTVVEGNQITLTITRSGDKPAETIYFSTLSDGTATFAEGDYATTSGGQPANIAITFSSGTTSRTVTLNILNDGVSDSGEQFRAIIQRSSSDPVSTYLDRSSYVTINDAAASVDVVREGTDTNSSLSMGASTSGKIDAEPISGDGVTSDLQGGFIDKDWYRVTLERGHVYTFNANSTSVSTGAVAISLYNANGSSVRSVTEGVSPSFTFDTTGQSSATQTYYFAISAGGPEPAWRTATGNYTLGLTDGGAPPPPPADDFRDELTDTTTPLGSLTLGGAINGYIGPADSNDSYGDKDVFQVDLTAGQIYDFRLRSTTVNGSSLLAGVFTIRDDSFNQLEISGSGSDEHEIFTAERTGIYYVRVGSGGNSSDTGGYRLEVNPVQASQVPDDWADDPNDAGVAGTLSPGTNRLGTIESSGDKDYFTVTLQAGKVYHFSVDAEDRAGAGAIGTMALSLRGPNSFNTSYLGFDNDSDRAGFDFQVTQSGVYYLRVGAGGNGSDTGGYRISVGSARTPPPPDPAPIPTPPGLTPVQELNHFLDNEWVGGIKGILTALGKDEFWYGLKLVLQKFDVQSSLGAANIIADRIHSMATVTDFSARWLNVLDVAYHGGDVAEAIVIEMGDFFAGETVSYISKGAAPFLITFGPFTAALGVVLAAGGGEWLYDVLVSDRLRRGMDIAWDGIVDYTSIYSTQRSSELTESSIVAAADGADEDLIFFDSKFYLESYTDVSDAIAQGSVGSAYAHYLTIGIDLGYQPNSSQILTRTDLAIQIVNNDAAILGNTALFTQALGQLAGDGISAAEQSVASALAATAGVSQGAVLDADLSALAHRKALDLAVNVTGDTIAAAGNTNSAWALQWSDGSDFAQAFAADLEALLGAGAPDASYRLFVTASSSGSAADVLARLQAQQGWNGSGFDTFGIAEFGGHWVVIVADRAAGVNAVAPGADTLTTAAIYGSGEGEFLFAGMRAGRLFGLDGNDTLVAGTGADYLDGGAGDDIYAVNGAQDRVIEAVGGGRDAVFATVSYALPADAEVEILSTFAHDGTAAMNLTGNAFAQEIWGNAGANTLAGGGGADSLIGGGGNDIYIADSDDMVFEQINGGADTVLTAVSYVLSSNQEIETLSTQTHAGTENLFLTGNQFNNILIGNAGDNIMNGVGGADVMYGLAGNDTYAIDDLGDLVVDGFGMGNDLVLTYLSHTLSNGNEVETLSTVFHQGTDAINLGGNDYNNTLIGNYGANYLNGNGGADVMIGLNGNDIYVVDNAADQVVEAAGGGSDLLYSFVSYALAAGQEVEAISTAVQGGTAAIALTGNEFSQTIAGNAGVNLLDGKGGSDVLYGFAGADTFAFTTVLGAGNVDAIADFVAGTDKIGLDDAIFSAIGGSLGAGAFVIGNGAGDADDRIIYNSATGALFYDADGSGAGAAVQFAALATGLALTSSDFAMI